MDLQSTGFFQNLSPDDKLLIRKVLDWIKLSENMFIVKYSNFLDERQCCIINTAFSIMHFKNFVFYGGYDNAKRRVLVIYSDGYNIKYNDFPFKPIFICFRKKDVLSHRDFLGCLMSHQIKRDMIGDITVKEGICAIFAIDSVYNYIIDNMSKVGSVGVELFKEMTDFDFDIENNYETIKGSVSSLRLDSVISIAIKLSRSRATELIKGIGVNVNYIFTRDPSQLINENDVFSIQGYGKYIFSEVSGNTKKGRLFIEVKKYI